MAGNSHEQLKVWKEELKGTDKDFDSDLRAKLERRPEGEVFVEEMKWSQVDRVIHNVSATTCRECKKVAIWLQDRVIWPVENEAPQPNVDLPESILRDYQEAGTILNLSPRGAASLLRLCIQKLCSHILQSASGKTIDADIAALVRKGLSIKVQQALDVVRVIGNEAVHPGTMDLVDDRATAEKLFDLVNLIAEVMISQPKHIEEMYSSLPPGNLEGIQQRDSLRLTKPGAG